MATSIRLTPEDEKRLESLVSRTGGTKDFYLREIIERGLEDLEDYFVAADVLNRLRSGSEKSILLQKRERNLPWTIEYTETALNDLRKLDKKTIQRIVNYIDRLTEGPGDL